MTFQTSASCPAPSLTARSTHSSSKSALTNDIKITSNPPLATMMAKKEAKEAHIEVGDVGVFSDYDKMQGQEQDRAFTNPFKHGACADSSVSSVYVCS